MLKRVLLDSPRENVAVIATLSFSRGQVENVDVKWTSSKQAHACLGLRSFDVVRPLTRANLKAIVALVDNHN